MKMFVRFIFISVIFFYSFSTCLFAQNKIKLGLLVPLTGEFSEIGQSIVKSTLLAINKIDNPLIEIIPKDTESEPEVTYNKAKQLKELGVKIVIGPVFNKNLDRLEDLDDMIFLSLTNKIIDNPKNIISTGINAGSQLNTISKFQRNNDLKKTILLVPNKSYKVEIQKAIKSSKIKTFKVHYYDSDPTKLTKQIEKITKYSQRKQNVLDEIERLKNSDDPNKEKKIKILEKRDTIGKIGFDSVIIADFDQSLKSLITSLIYTDVLPLNTYFITLNQWFDESLLKETSYQPIYYPSVNKKNYDDFIKLYFEKFNQYPNQLSFLSYDLVGLVYYLIFQNNWNLEDKIFLKKNKFKGKVGVFEIKDKKINHILNFYKIENNNIKKIF